MAAKFEYWDCELCDKEFIPEHKMTGPRCGTLKPRDDPSPDDDIDTVDNKNDFDGSTTIKANQIEKGIVIKFDNHAYRVDAITFVPQKTIRLFCSNVFKDGDTRTIQLSSANDVDKLDVSYVEREILHVRNKIATCKSGNNILLYNLSQTPWLDGEYIAFKDTHTIFAVIVQCCKKEQIVKLKLIDIMWHCDLCFTENVPMTKTTCPRCGALKPLDI